MEELKKSLQSTFDKHKFEYKSVCETLSGLESRKNNALKFDSYNEKLISEIMEKLNEFIKINPNVERNEIIEIGQSYIKDFQKQLINPFS